MNRSIGLLFLAALLILGFCLWQFFLKDQGAGISLPENDRIQKNTLSEEGQPDMVSRIRKEESLPDPAEKPLAGDTREFLPPETEPVVEKPLIHGQVVNSKTGDPVSQFTFWIAKADVTFNALLQDKSKVLITQSVSDAEGGRFSFSLDKDSRYSLHVNSAKCRSSKSYNFEVKEGLATERIIVRLDPYLTLTGIVVEKGSERPIPGAKVEGEMVSYRARDADGSIVSYRARGAEGTVSRSYSYASTTTDAEGVFLLKELYEGLHSVKATHEDYATQTSEAVAGGEPVIIRMQQGYRIRGRILNDSGRVAVGVEVRLTRPDGLEIGPFTSRSDGCYETLPLLPGPLRIAAKKYSPPVLRQDNTSTWSDPASIATKALDTAVDFTEEGFRIEIVDQDLVVDFGPSLNHVTWTGIFYDSQGLPVPEGQVRVWNDRIANLPTGTRIEKGVSIHRTSNCDGLGRFEFKKLVPGGFKIDMCRKEDRMQGFYAERQQITFDRPGLFQVDLHLPANELSGLLIDGETGEPYSGPLGIVSATCNGRDYFQNVESDGSFFFRGIPAGVYTVTAQCVDKASVNHGQVSLGEKQIIDDLRIVLPITGFLTVKVSGLGEVKERIIEMAVNHSDGSGAWTVGPGQYSEDGTWTIEHIAQEVGSWILVLTEARLGRVERPYTIHPGSSIELKFKASDFQP